VVSIDDWALRKGHTDATVIVDLERHHIVAVLPDRQPETVAQWLIAHPGITVVSRDRAKGDGTAIRDGAPDTRQMADRWHLLKNLRDAL
jgi:transposase